MSLCGDGATYLAICGWRLGTASPGDLPQPHQAMQHLLYREKEMKRSSFPTRETAKNFLCFTKEHKVFDRFPLCRLQQHYELLQRCKGYLAGCSWGQGT
eukprot:c25250_g1_i1 orf=1-294(-)